MNIAKKLEILVDSAKYDVACTSSGSDRKSKSGIGSTVPAGICHSFAADGRCISLLKILMTNACTYDCLYCVNRRSNDTPRATLTPRELADLTIQFYRRNYIEGLFLSSGILKNPNHTCELMIETLRLLRDKYHFHGYIHAKAIPGADQVLLDRLGLLADRMSVNIELPSQNSLELLAPDKKRTAIFTPMKYIAQRIQQKSKEMTVYKHTPNFTPAGQSTQMIIGATPESDYQILNLTESLYQTYQLKRVFFSAYIPVSQNALLPSSLSFKPPLQREHRLYQADWLLRFYKFSAKEILDAEHPYFNPYIDPKCNWALHHLEFFPVEVNSAPYEALLRVPGIGVRSAQRILIARNHTTLDVDSLKKLGVVLKRARYFLTCKGRSTAPERYREYELLRALMSPKEMTQYQNDGYSVGGIRQLSFFQQENMIQEGSSLCIAGPR